ncbi:hypothetical protein P5E67_00735 [Vibrio parahaemolyticus]|nr:hypothetical protein [Vibrio parahaemolyticus]
MIKGTWNSFYLRSIKGVAAKLAAYFVATESGFVELTADGKNVATADYVAPIETFEVMGEATVDGDSIQYDN